MEQWMVNEIATGFQKLLSLGLDRQPANDVIDVTVATWCESISHGRVFYASDASRFRFAFSALASHNDKWPTPRQFLEALPQRPDVYEKPVLRLVSDERIAEDSKAAEESKVRVNAIIQDLAKKLRIEL